MTSKWEVTDSEALPAEVSELDEFIFMDRTRTSKHPLRYR